MLKLVRKMSSETAERFLVFTYGTLKRGEPNHDVLTTETNGRAEFVGSAVTTESYPLVVASRYNIPFLLDRPGLGHRVEGELYWVDTRMLAALDDLESHPDFYVRREESVEKTGGEILRPWIYFLPKCKPELLEKKPYLTSYKSAGDHGLPYVARYSRDPRHAAKTDVFP